MLGQESERKGMWVAEDSSDPAECMTCFAFGRKPRILGRDEEATATFDERVASAWGYLVVITRRFSEKRMTARERANCDFDDMMHAILIELIEKDHRFDVTRGVKYVTFATMLAQKVLLACKDRAHTVQCPTNSATRLKRADSMDADGSLTLKREIGAHQILHARSQYADIRSDMAVYEEQPGASLEEEEEIEATSKAAVLALSSMCTYSAMLVGHSIGLWNQPPKTWRQIAEMVGYTPARVNELGREAISEFRRKVMEIRGIKED